MTIRNFANIEYFENKISFFVISKKKSIGSSNLPLYIIYKIEFSQISLSTHIISYNIFVLTVKFDKTIKRPESTKESQVCR